MATNNLEFDVAPPAFLQLAGHPLRWRLLGELARSDRMVHELTSLIGEAQNLVSYHLGKLRDGRVVHARRSSADGRDTYYGLDLAAVRHMLSAAGGALHPGLRLTAPVREKIGDAPVRVLFLCTGNSARSQMAEALARAFSGGAIAAASAGSHPKPLHPNAIKVMTEVHWSLANPATGEPDDATYALFLDSAAELATRIDFLLTRLAARSQEPIAVGEAR